MGMNHLFLQLELIAKLTFTMFMVLNPCNDDAHREYWRR